MMKTEDPIEVGMTMHQPLMLLIRQLNPTEEQFIVIARLTDILLGSAQVSAVRHGLERSEAEYVKLIREKLESLGIPPQTGKS